MPKLTEHRNGQLRLTVPKKLAVALNLKKGDVLEFIINKKGKLELVRL